MKEANAWFSFLGRLYHTWSYVARSSSRPNESSPCQSTSSSAPNSLDCCRHGCIHNPLCLWNTAHVHDKENYHPSTSFTTQPRWETIRLQETLKRAAYNLEPSIRHKWWCLPYWVIPWNVLGTYTNANKLISHLGYPERVHFLNKMPLVKLQPNSF